MKFLVELIKTVLIFIDILKLCLQTIVQTLIFDSTAFQTKLYIVCVCVFFFYIFTDFILLRTLHT